MLTEVRPFGTDSSLYEQRVLKQSRNLFIDHSPNQNRTDQFHWRVSNRAANSSEQLQTNPRRKGAFANGSLASIQRWFDRLIAPHNNHFATNQRLSQLSSAQSQKRQRFVPQWYTLYANGAVQISQEFEQFPMHFKQGWLYDLGVVDANNDNVFDIFTTNHNATESLLLGSPSGDYKDVLSQWKLDQDRRFPGLGDFVFSPLSNAKGLFIYRLIDTELHLESQRGKGTKPIRGEIVLPSPRDNKTPSVVVLSKDRAKVSIKEHPWQHGLQTHIRFRIRPNGRLVLNTRFSDTLYTLNLDKSLPLNQVYVGARHVHPPSHKFTFHLHDRHGMAWADFQGDGYTDVFMSRGGLRGQIQNFPTAPPIRDELFVNIGDGTFQDRAAQLGFEKQGCRARKVAWVDFNQDNRLDLYIAGLRSPNQLFRQQPNGRFTNVAARQGVRFRDSGPFEWTDADNDGDSDLLIARGNKLMLYRNQPKQFNLYQNLPIPGADFRKLTIADYDQDGDFDVYAASPNSSKLLINYGGRYAATDPVTVGLPDRALTANWVDYDNDGLADLHTMPGQLYRQLPDRQFVASQLVKQDVPSWAAVSENIKSNNARSAWFDADNNGTRDALCEVVQNGSGQAILYRNLLTQNHWLQLQLVGPRGNRQAIGAKVALTTSNSKQFQQVGQSEGSHYSQGHYRLYFGFGQQQEPGLIQITWADGTQQKVRYSKPDQLLTVRYRK